jgi:carboxypeptidase T
MRPKFTRSFLIVLILTIPLFTQPVFQPTNFGIGKQPGQSPAIVKIYFDGVNELNWLAARYDIWEVDHNSGHLLAYLTPAEVGELNSNGFRLEIDQDLNSRLHQPSRLIPNQYFGIPGYPCYRTVEETYATFAQLLIDYPDLTSLPDMTYNL